MKPEVKKAKEKKDGEKMATENSDAPRQRTQL
jgi:hypothetical protein